MRKEFAFWSIAIVLVAAALAIFVTPLAWYSFIVIGPLFILGWHDYLQTGHAINRIFPIIGHFRYILEEIRPEINQYFIESNHDGTPINREQRSVVYQRAKGQLDTIPFGTQHDVYKDGYEWVCHSLNTVHLDPGSLRLSVGGKDCKQPYNASMFNIAAMSYGSLSKNAILALNGGAKDGGFAHNTGEGAISPYHKEPGGDLIWQIGTGYFGCRTEDGGFDELKFAKKAQTDQVKMIELKLSQGAKPGHGGILPAAKVNEEIAEIRDVPVGKDVLSPSTHRTFSDPKGMLNFVKKLRELSGAKPVGFKLSIGNRHEFIAICKAMIETGIKPDFITVDGGEAGTGAAPLEFSNFIGEPGVEALIFVHNMLRGFDLRNDIKIAATGKITNAFGMVKRIALGADLFYSGRAMMLALGCIQALRCNSNFCPAGVATQDSNLYEGLVVPDKRRRVANFHRETVRSLAEILGAMGIAHPHDLRPWHIKRRINQTEVRDYSQLYTFVNEGDLLNEKTVPNDYLKDYLMASSDTFQAKEEFCSKKLNDLSKLVDHLN